VNGNLTVVGNIITTTNITNITTTTNTNYTLNVSQTDLSLNGRFYTSGDVSLNGRLFVNQDASFNGRVVVGSDVSMVGRLFVQGTTIQSGKITATSGIISISDSSFNSRVLVGSDLSLGGRLFVQGATILSGGINGDASFNKKLFVGSDVSMNSNLYVKGATVLSGGINGDTSFNNRILVGSDVSLGGRLFVTGQATFIGAPIMMGNNIQVGTIPGNAIIGGVQTNGVDLSSNQTINGVKTFGNVITANAGIISISDVSFGGNLVVSSNLGIGTTTPQFTIDTNGGGVGCGRVVQFNASTGNNFASGGTTSNFDGGTVTNDISLNSRLFVGGDVSLNSKLYVSTGLAINKQTLTPGYVLDINGSAIGTAFQTTSDYRIKENPVSLNDGFSIDNLNPVFYYNTELKKNDIGLLAHEVQEHYPYLVNGEKDGENLQSVNYTGLIGILIKEIQQAKQEIKDLKIQLNIMNNK
jgi:hypothetical protein